MFLFFSLQGVSGFLCHSHQTNLGVCEILVLGNPLLKRLIDLGLTSLSTFFSHIATVSGCSRELNAHF